RGRVPTAFRCDRHRRGPGDGPRALPCPRGAACPACRHAVWWGAADARDRAGAHEPPTPPLARRAVAGPGAAHGRADLRDDRGAQAAGPHDPARRAERAPGLRGRRSRVRAGDRPDHARRPRRRAATRPEGRALLSRRGGRRDRGRQAMTDYAIHQVVNALSAGSLYALMAVGLAMVFGILRLISFAHGDLMMIAAYLAAFSLGAGFPLEVAIPTMVAGTVLVGLLVERIAYRPIRGPPDVSI